MVEQKRTQLWAEPQQSHIMLTLTWLWDKSLGRKEWCAGRGGESEQDRAEVVGDAQADNLLSLRWNDGKVIRETDLQQQQHRKEERKGGGEGGDKTVFGVRGS